MMAATSSTTPNIAPVALESTDVTILTKGILTNKGYGIENSFTLNWEMGTQQGSMNPSAFSIKW